MYNYCCYLLLNEYMNRTNPLKPTAFVLKIFTFIFAII